MNLYQYIYNVSEKIRVHLNAEVENCKFSGGKYKQCGRISFILLLALKRVAFLNYFNMVLYEDMLMLEASF